MSVFAPVIPFTADRVAPKARRFWLLRMLDAWQAHQREAASIRPRCD